MLDGQVVIGEAALLVVDASGRATDGLGALVGDGGAGVPVVAVRSLHEARQQIAERAFDCIIVDLALPDASGLESLAILASVVPDTPIVVVSPEDRVDLAIPALGEGAQEFVVREGLTPDVLRDAVERARQRKAAGRRLEERRRVAAAVLNTIEAPTVALDGTGRIIATSAAWDRTAIERGASSGAVGRGVDYLATCDAATGPWSEEAAEVAAGIRRVLAGDLDRFVADSSARTGRGIAGTASG